MMLAPSPAKATRLIHQPRSHSLPGPGLGWQYAVIFGPIFSKTWLRFCFILRARFRVQKMDPKTGPPLHNMNRRPQNRVHFPAPKQARKIAKKMRAQAQNR